MHSDDRRQYLTATDLAMLSRVLDNAGLGCSAEQADDGRRGRAARFLIAHFEQGITTETALVQVLQASLASADPMQTPDRPMSADRLRSDPTPMVATAGGYRYGRRVEKNGTWTIYHVFSGVPAEYASWKMVGLNVKTADRALRILNTPAVARPSP